MQSRYFFPEMNVKDEKSATQSSSSSRAKEITGMGHAAFAELCESFGWDLTAQATDAELSESLEIKMLPAGTLTLLEKCIGDLEKAAKAAEAHQRSDPEHIIQMHEKMRHN